MSHKFQKITFLFVFFSFLFLQNSKAINIKSIEKVEAKVNATSPYPMNVETDSSGYPHISFYDSNTAKFLYASFDGTQWNLEEIGERPSLWHFLKLDSIGYAHIVYEKYGEGIKHVWFDGAVWNSEIVLSDTVETLSLSVDIDSGDYLHLSYYIGKDLVHAYQDASGWNFETVYTATTSLDSAITKLSIDNLNKPHIIFMEFRYSSDTETVGYFYNDGTWHKNIIEELPDGADYQIYYSAFSIDNSGVSHFVYAKIFSDADYDEIIHASFNGTTWDSELVTTAVKVTGHMNLSFDSSNNPHFIYVSEESKDTYSVIYNYHDGLSWNSKVVSEAYYAALTLDSSDNPEIAFRLESGGLFYARYDGFEWKTETVLNEQEDAEGQNISLMLDSKGIPHATCVTSKGELWYLTKSDENWETEKVSPVEISYDESRPPQITLDSKENPYIVGTNYDGDTTFSYFYLDDLEWNEKVLFYPDDSNKSIKFDFDSKDFPHFLFETGPSGSSYENFYYSYYDGTDYLTEELLSSVAYLNVNPHSIVMDSNDNPHILSTVYNRSGSPYNGLYYGYHDSEGWHYTEIADTITPYSFSLVLDQNNNPHITYTDYTDGFSVMYAYYDGSIWNYETITTSEVCVPTYPSLSLDTFGNPHITFYDRDDYCTDPSLSTYLNYAHRDATGWHTEVVDDLGAKDPYGTSISIYNYEAHIGYTGSASVLRYAVITIEDKDGDSDKAVEYGGEDCDDLDPARSSIIAEVCGDEIDNNCSGEVDEESACPTGTGEETGATTGSTTEGGSESSGSSTTSGTETGTESDGGTETASETTGGMSTGTESSAGSGSTGGEGSSGSESSGETSTTGLDPSPGDNNSTDSNASSCSLHVSL